MNDVFPAYDPQEGAARPLVGVICCTLGKGDDATQGVYESYLRAAPLFGADVVLIPSLPELTDARRLVRRLDGVLLTGSVSNVEPRRYGSDAPGDGPFDPARDATALALIEVCVRRDRPLLAICRGFQEVAVALGGTLRRDLGQAGRAQIHHLPGELSDAETFALRHEVRLTPGGILARAVGSATISVTSAHFQGIARASDMMRVEAVSGDGIIEAIRPADGARLLAVQWHPEWQAEQDAASMSLFALYAAMLRGASWDQAVGTARASQPA
jgi:putative glutamine amidotransferase